MKLTGFKAIEAAEAGDRIRLNKYTDPIQGALYGISTKEARDIAREDPSLIWAEILPTDEMRDQVRARAKVEAEKATTFSSWRQHFDASYDVPASITDRFRDVSYHNDSCPSFVDADAHKPLDDEEHVLWVEHPDPAKRAYDGAPRYMVTDGHHDSVTYEGDDMEEAIRVMEDGPLRCRSCGRTEDGCSCEEFEGD